MISDGSSPVVPPGTAPAGTPHTQSLQPETRSVSAVTVAGSEVKPSKTPPLDNIVQVPQSGIGGFGQNGILGWTVEGVKAALGAHLAGTFGGTGMLSDAMWSHPVIKKCREERNDFLSKIPRQVTPRRKRDKAARYAADLSYLPLMQALEKRYEGKLRIQTVVSRETAVDSLTGRVPALIESGELEKAVGLPMDKETIHVMLCGNPQMVRDTQQLLKETRQMTKHLRRRPGHMTAEHYW